MIRQCAPTFCSFNHHKYIHDLLVCWIMDTLSTFTWPILSTHMHLFASKEPHVTSDDKKHRKLSKLAYPKFIPCT